MVESKASRATYPLAEPGSTSAPGHGETNVEVGEKPKNQFARCGADTDAGLGQARARGQRTNHRPSYSLSFEIFSLALFSYC